jgi:hypothetical protein
VLVLVAVAGAGGFILGGVEMIVVFAKDVCCKDSIK